MRKVGDFGAVSTYDDVDGLELPGAVVFVDFAGNSEVARAVHRRFSDRLVRSIVVGGTHAKSFAMPASMPGPAPELFDGPGAIDRRRERHGGRAHDEEYDVAEDAFVTRTATWLNVDRRAGSRAVVEAFAALWSKGLAVDRGYVIRP